MANKKLFIFHCYLCDHKFPLFESMRTHMLFAHNKYIQSCKPNERRLKLIHIDSMLKHTKLIRRKHYENHKIEKKEYDKNRHINKLWYKV